MQPSKEEITKALEVIFVAIKGRGDNFMEGTLFVDGEMFKLKIMIREIVE